jgi:hypothetical protein
MKIKSWMLGLLVIALIFGGIALSSITGDWQTTSSKIPSKYTEGDFAGQSNPADIRGSYTFADISANFKIPLDDLAAGFGIENNADKFQVKELESLYVDSVCGASVGTDSVRLFVAYYKGLPFTPSDSDYLLPEAVKILKEKATLSQEQISFLDAHIFLLSSSSVPPVSTQVDVIPSPTATAITHTTTAGTVTGKVTFQELIDWGLTEEEIENVINDQMPEKSVTLRDYATQKGIEFSLLKDQFQTVLNSLE